MNGNRPMLLLGAGGLFLGLGVLVYYSRWCPAAIPSAELARQNSFASLTPAWLNIPGR